MRSVQIMLTGMILCLLALSATAQQPKQMPPFTFLQLDSKPFTEKNLQKGRTSVFVLFDSGCDHCQKEIPSIGKKYSQLVNCSFYFVSFNEVNQISDFMKTYGKDFQGKKNVVVLRDSNRQFLPTFFPEKFPAVFMYNPKGNLVYYKSGNQDHNSMIRAANASKF